MLIMRYLPNQRVPAFLPVLTVLTLTSVLPGIPVAYGQGIITKQAVAEGNWRPKLAQLSPNIDAGRFSANGIPAKGSGSKASSDSLAPAFPRDLKALDDLVIRAAPANNPPKKKQSTTKKQPVAKPATSKPAKPDNAKRPQPAQRPPQKPTRTTSRPPPIPGVVVKGIWSCQIITHTLIGKFARRKLRLRFGRMQLGFSSKYYQNRVKYRIQSRRGDTGWLTAAEWGTYSSNGPALALRMQGSHPAPDPKKSRSYSALVHRSGNKMNLETDSNGEQVNMRCVQRK